VPKIIPRMSGLMQQHDVLVVSVAVGPGHTGQGYGILGTLSAQAVPVEYIAATTGPDDSELITFAVPQRFGAEVEQAINELPEGVQGRIAGSMALICVFGPHFREIPGVAGPIAKMFGEQGIMMQSMSTSTSTVACLTSRQHLSKAAAALKRLFAAER